MSEHGPYQLQDNVTGLCRILDHILTAFSCLNGCNGAGCFSATHFCVGICVSEHGPYQLEEKVTGLCRILDHILTVFLVLMVAMVQDCYSNECVCVP